jgi:hypothetical protein
MDPLVVRTTDEATVGAGVMVPVMVMACPVVYDVALVERVIVDVAPKAASGPKTKKAARMTVANVLIVYISITV